MDKKKIKTLLISTGDAYNTDGLENQDTVIIKPYTEKNIAGRIARELWFRAHFSQDPWFNKNVLNYDPEVISVRDPQITTAYLAWLQKQFPKAQILYEYDNLVGSCKRSLMPNQVPEGVSITTYDENDSEKYSLILRAQGGEFPKEHLRERQSAEYDVFYIGADKGRAEYILKLKDEMEAMGLKTKIMITKEYRTDISKSFYVKKISYDEVLDYDTKSKAVMNIILPGQKAATVRDFEALYLRSKLITNNKNIKNFDFYKPENIFILGEDSMENLKEFINSPFVDVDPVVYQRHLR